MQDLGIIQWCLEHLNYWTITLLMTIESSFIPFPSEVVIPPAAWKAAGDGSMSVPLIVVFGTLGADIGALVNYFLSISLGRAIIYRFVESRLGKMCLLSRKKMEKAEEYFKAHGAVSTLVGRLIPAVRQLISIPAGLSRMHLGQFLAYTTLGVLVWNSILAVLGWSMSKVPGISNQEELVSTVSRYSDLLGYAFILLGVLIVSWIVFKEVRKRKKNKES